MDILLAKTTSGNTIMIVPDGKGGVVYRQLNGDLFTGNCQNLKPILCDNGWNVEVLVASAQNDLPDLATIPTHLGSIFFIVNQAIIDNQPGSGISVNSAGQITVNSVNLGYNIEISDRVVVFYK